MATMKMPAIAFIVARSEKGHVIGCENRLPWRLRTDMRFFREVTTDHAVIMGRKTFDSIGRPLANRFNIVISRADGNNSHNLAWVKDRESALFLADYYSILHGKTHLIVVGGAEVYRIFEDLVNMVFLTEVFHEFPDGDAFFDFTFDRRRWKIHEERDYSASDDDEYNFRITTYKRRLGSVRQRELSEFLSKDELTDAWMERDRIARAAEDFERLPSEQFRLPMERSSRPDRSTG